MYRERETKRKRERQERIYSLPLAYTNKIRKRSLWLPRELYPPSSSLSLSLSSPVNQWTHKLIPLSFIIDRIFLLSLGSVHESSPPFTLPIYSSRTHRPRVITPPLLRLSPSPLSPRHRPSHFLNLPRVRAISRRASSSAKSRQPMPYILHPVSRYTSNAFHRT